MQKTDLKKVTPYLWEIPKKHWDKMNVPEFPRGKG